MLNLILVYFLNFLVFKRKDALRCFSSINKSNVNQDFFAVNSYLIRHESIIIVSLHIHLHVPFYAHI